MRILHNVLSIIDLSSRHRCFSKRFQDLIRCSFRGPIRNSTINFLLFLNAVCICLILFSNLYTSMNLHQLADICTITQETYQVFTTNHSHKTLVDAVTITTDNHMLPTLAWIRVCWHDTGNSGSRRLSNLNFHLSFHKHRTMKIIAHTTPFRSYSGMMLSIMLSMLS